MKKFDAIIFDMDGTIIDTDHIWKTVTLDLLHHRDITFSQNEQQELLTQLNGVSLKDSCRIIKEKWQLSEEIDDLINEKIINAYAMYEQGVVFVDGFEAFHQSLTSHNLLSGVATNASPAIVDITNKILNLEKFFGSHMYCVAHVNYVGKPNPAIFLHTARQLNVKPHRCMVIEDSTTGIQAAKAADMFCIGINTSHNRDLLQQADMIVEGYHEIVLPVLLT